MSAALRSAAGVAARQSAASRPNGSALQPRRPSRTMALLTAVLGGGRRSHSARWTYGSPHERNGPDVFADGRLPFAPWLKLLILRGDVAGACSSCSGTVTGAARQARSCQRAAHEAIGWPSLPGAVGIRDRSAKAATKLHVRRLLNRYWPRRVVNIVLAPGVGRGRAPRSGESATRPSAIALTMETYPTARTGEKISGITSASMPLTCPDLSARQRRHGAGETPSICAAAGRRLSSCSATLFTVARRLRRAPSTVSTCSSA